MSVALTMTLSPPCVRTLVGERRGEELFEAQVVPEVLTRSGRDLEA